MTQIPQSRIVYHGTSLPPWSSSNLRPPTLVNPFFVASAPRIAISYMQGEENGSIFVFRLKDVPENISLNLYSDKGIDALANRLPSTGRLLREFMHGEGGFGQNPNFWLLSQIMVFFLECCFRTGKEEVDVDWLVGDARERMSGIWENAKMNSISKFVSCLSELGIVSVRNGKMRIVDPRMSKAMDKVDDAIGVMDYFDEEITDEQHAAGRVIKSRINRIASEMGYLMVGDQDSSQSTDYGYEHEYAVFDKSAFDYAVETSIPEDEVYQASEALARGLDFKGSGLNDPDEKAANILSKVKDSWIRRGDFPNFVKAGATRISVPRNVTHVSDFALSDFKNLEYIEFSEKTENFGRFCLAYCWNLKKVVFKGKEFNRFSPNKSVHSIFSSPSGPYRQKVEIVVPPGFKGDLEKVKEWDEFKVTVSE